MNTFIQTYIVIVRFPINIKQSTIKLKIKNQSYIEYATTTHPPRTRLTTTKPNHNHNRDPFHRFIVKKKYI